MTSADWDARYAGADLVWSAGPNVWVERVAADFAPGRAIDLAGGEGRNALWLAERGWTALCVDFSRVALERATQLAEQRLDATSGAFEVLWADLGTYVPPAQSYDLVLVIYVHLPAAQRQFILTSAAAAVALGGHLLVVAHHSDNLTDGVGGPQNPELLYSQRDIEHDLAASGLLAERSERVLRDVPGEAGVRQAVDALYLGYRPN